MKTVAITALLLFISTGIGLSQVGALPNRDFSLKKGQDQKFHVGEVWEYLTRPGEEHSRLTILRIDHSPELGTIIHVSVNDVKLHNCLGGPEPDAVPHMPFARKALEASVKKRVALNQPLPTFEPGYDNWKAAYTRKKAGIYVITVAQAVSIAEATFRQGIGCDSEAEKSSSRQ